MSRTKIMLFSHICGSSYITGAEKYLFMLTSELSRQFDCTLVVPDGGLLLQQAKQIGLRTIVQPLPLVWGMFKPEEDVVQELDEKIRRHEHSGLLNLLHIEQPELVIVNTVVNPMPAVAAKALGIPVAWFITETIPEQRYTSQAARWVDRYADWIIGISESTLQPFRKAGLEGKLSLLPPTWHAEELHPEHWMDYRERKRSELGIDPEQRVIGYISSSLHPEKGLDHFVHMALKVCPEVPDTMFLIVGIPTRPEFIEGCEQKIRESGYESRFRRLTFEPSIEKLYPAMDFVVVPSLIEEGFGMTALEGLIFGKQVIAYRAGGLEEIMRTTGNASGLVTKGDADALAWKMLEKLKAGSTEHKHQANRQEAEEAFGYGAYSKRLGRLAGQLQARCTAAAAERNTSPMPPLLMNAVYKSKAASVVFLLENGVKRPFASSDAFHFFKYQWSDIHVLADAALHRLPTSKPVSTLAPFHYYRPSVMLAKGRGPTVYLLVNHQRFPFVSPLSAKQRGFDLHRTVTVPDLELEKLELGNALEELAPAAAEASKSKRRKKQAGRRGSRAAGRRKGMRPRSVKAQTNITKRLRKRKAVKQPAETNKKRAKAGRAKRKAA